MLEILKFVFSSFWIWLGTLILLNSFSVAALHLWAFLLKPLRR